MSYPDHELVALYCAETRQSERIVAPFIAAGLEPPHRDVTDRIGFNSRENKIIHKGDA